MKADDLGELDRKLAELRMTEPSDVDNTNGNVIHVDFINRRRIQ